MLAFLIIAICLASALLTRLFLVLCPRLGLVDVPNQRSSHIKVTPRGGGVVFVLLFFLSSVAVLRWMEFSNLNLGVMLAFGAAAFPIAVIGFVDDLVSLRAMVRLGMQFLVAAAVVWWIGEFDAFSLPGLPDWNVPVFGYLLTILWILGLTNVYNFMDGIDGIASGQGIIAALGWAVASLVFFGSEAFFAVNLLLAAVLAGFLVWNWHPAKIFMGDVGSGFLGFFFAVQPLALLQTPGAPDRTSLLALASGFMVWPFVYDGCYTFVRRAFLRENVLQAHRTHLYQRMTKLGWSHSRVALLYLSWAFVSALCAGFYVYGGIRGWVALQWITVGGLLGSGFLVSAGVVMVEKRVRRLRKVYLSAPSHSSLELDYVTEVLRSNWIAPMGPELEFFEGEFKAYVRSENACALSSGTAALHLLLKAYGVGVGDKVMVSDFTFVATVNPILYVGAEPVLLDADRETWNVSLETIREAVEAIEKEDGRPPRALILAHIYGICSDLGPIAEFCREKGILFLEDAAEAVGSLYRGKHLGTIGDAAAFSFNGNKIMTTGGGGMVVSANAALVEKVRFLSSQARENEPHYEHREIGYNQRMSNVLAAVGRAQLRRLPSFLQARERNLNFYRNMVGDFPGVTFMPTPEWCAPNGWLTNILIDAQQAGFSAGTLRRAMENENIEARPLWKPMHMQPLYAERGTRVFGGEVGAELFLNGLSLPSGSPMTDNDRERVAAVWIQLTKG